MADLDSKFLKPLVSDSEDLLTPEKRNQIKSAARQFRSDAGHAVLVVGASATEKTMTTSLLGKFTSMNVYRVDLSLVASKFIGETEKNLSQVFETGEKLNAVLLFDEADGLFGNRTKPGESIDRFTNLDVKGLLDRIEAYSGLAVLTSNLRRSVDGVFLRRMTWVIDYSKTVMVQRLPLWQRMSSWLQKSK